MRLWNIMRRVDQVWVSDFFESKEEADDECDRRNAEAGYEKYEVAEQ